MRQWGVGRWLRGIRSLREPRRQRISHIFDKLSLLPVPDIALEINLDLWKLQSAYEAYYATALEGVRRFVEMCSVQGVTEDVHERGILWKSRLLRTDYRTAKKSTIQFWTNTVRYEWRT